MNKKTEIQHQDTEKVPPQALDMEEAVLCALMIESNAIEIAMQIVRPQHFYKEAHGLIFSSIISLYRNSNPVDLITVTEQLKKDCVLDKVGGPYFVSKLTSKIASAYNIEYHSLIIAEKYLLREFITYSSNLQRLAFDPSVDLDNLIETANLGLDSILEGINDCGSGETSLPGLLKKSLSEYDQRAKLYKNGQFSGIITPITKLTKLLNGWQKGDLIIIAGRPSMGKTAFVLSVAKKAAKLNEHPCIFSLEMNSVRLTDRLLCGEAGIMPETYGMGCMDDTEKIEIEKAVNRLYKLGIYIDDNSSVNMDYIRNKSRVLHRKGKCSLIIIDYLQLIETPKTKTKLREQEVAELSRKAKLLAKELNVPVILLAQLNRGVETRGDKRPMLSDLRESGSIEQDADVVILLYRDEYYGIETDDYGSTVGKGEAIIAKHRNGRTGMVFFGYNNSLTNIYDWVNPSDMPKIPNDLLNDKD